ncbi:MAG: hypothetical protein IPG78_18455 [Ignavibacteria bacterium]|nr:hypothetical protein [Ignavibacteria bacterium]
MNPGGAYFLATTKSDGTTKILFGTSKESGDKKQLLKQRLKKTSLQVAVYSD